jgi:hypothetical protein
MARQISCTMLDKSAANIQTAYLQISRTKIQPVKRYKRLFVHLLSQGPEFDPMEFTWGWVFTYDEKQQIHTQFWRKNLAVNGHLGY